MKKEDIRVVILFIVLILLIISVLIFNSYKFRKRENVNRKLEYIFEKYTYANILDDGTKLFFDGLNILNNNNLSFEKNKNDSIKYYSIKDYSTYKKILNMDNLFNIFSKDITEDYMKDKKIIKYNDEYYIENYVQNINKDYIGSNVEISSYDDNYVYFNSVNYYCKNEEYIGLITDEPNCDYVSTKTNFKVILEGSSLRILDYHELLKIIE